MVDGFITKRDMDKDDLIQFSEFWTFIRTMDGAPSAPAPDLLAAGEVECLAVRACWGVQTLCERVYACV